MKYYAGLDVSMKTTSICIVNQEKKIVFAEEIATDPDAICSAIRSTKLDIENSAVESGSISRWLVQEISLRGLSIVCVDAHKMSKILSININKTDKNDAYLIAEAFAISLPASTGASNSIALSLLIVLAAAGMVV